MSNTTTEHKIKVDYAALEVLINKYKQLQKEIKKAQAASAKARVKGKLEAAGGMKRQIDGLNDQIKANKKLVAEKAKAATGELKSATSITAALARNKRIEEYKQKQAKHIPKQIKEQRGLDRAVKNANSQLANQLKMGKEIQRPFQGYAMSLMFAGMALKRMFDTIWKSTTKTFQEISHSVENSTTQFDMLKGSMKFLQFTVGQALEPIADRLIPIIDRLSEWVDLHPKFTAFAAIFTAIAGTLLMVGGMTILAVEGFIGLGAKLGFLKLASTGAISSTGKLAGILSKMVTPVGLVVAGLLLLAGISWKALKETPGALDSVRESAKKLKTPLTGLWESLERLINNFFPKFNFELGEFGFFIAWTIKKIVTHFSVIVNAITTVIDAITLLIKALKALGWAFALRFGKAKEEMAGIKEQALQVAESFKSILSAAGEYESLKDFKAGLISEQMVEARDERDAKLGNVVNVNIGELKTDSMEQMLAEVYRMASVQGVELGRL